ncbi:MAG: hypothetical protein AMXMBFR46_15070, partial [Acidimicrobiia bacterium]
AAPACSTRCSTTASAGCVPHCAVSPTAGTRSPTCSTPSGRDPSSRHRRRWSSPSRSTVTSPRSTSPVPACSGPAT